MDDFYDNVTADSTTAAGHEAAAGTPSAEAVPEKGRTAIDLVRIIDMVGEAEGILSRIRHLLGQFSPDLRLAAGPAKQMPNAEEPGTATIVEGIFDGQKMVGPDGKSYTVPANYASKSKLVEGDLLTLSITERGAFVYKQIGPIVRHRLRGLLIRTPSAPHEWAVKVDGRTYRILTASVTYFRGREGDEVVILVPENGESRWAAVENIMRRDSDSPLSQYSE